MAKVLFYNSSSWNKEYEQRWKYYRNTLEKKFPGKFDWALDETTVKKMVRCEMELIALDRAIVNEATKQDDGFLFVPKHLIDQREKLAKRDAGYHKSLMLDMEVRIRHKISFEQKGGSKKDRMRAAFAQANAKDLQP